MDKCKNCGEPFTREKVSKKVFTYDKITCNRCGQKHKITIPSRFILGGLLALDIIFSFHILPDLIVTHGLEIIVFFAIFFILLVFIAPYLIMFKKSK